MDPITADRLDELTREPLLAVLSTVNPDGTPQSTPLWYHYDGEYLICACYSHRIKARNIRQNQRSRWWLWTPSPPPRA